nr:immunoglobulin light chain junction region [Macaca mulatta]MOV37560.1 immunoglobulin light chain junction region [Macaca mulatta]MOV37642.1 immunoglobulin light chain junction region [Macaca mulatta]
CLQYDTEPLTF